MHFRWILESEAHSIVHPGLWECWQGAILQQVPWLFHAVLIQSAAGYTVVWVDTTEGLVTWDLGDFVYSNLWTYILYTRMQYQYWVFELGLDAHLWDVVAAGLQDIGEAVLKSFRQVVLFSILPENQVARIRQLATS